MPESRPIVVVTAAVTVRVQVATSVIAPEPDDAAATLGDRLARRADQLVRDRGLGYYPALDFFIQAGDFDRELLGGLERASARALEYASREIPRRLKPVFSSVRLHSAQFIARALPPVRPGPPEALAALARHYTPDTLRIELKLGTVTRGPAEGLERVAAQKVVWWLREHFASVEVVDARSRED